MIRTGLRVYKRQLSTLLGKNPNKLRLSDVKSPQLNHDDLPSRIQLIQSVNQSNNEAKQELLDELIPDFSVFFKLKASDYSNEILKRIIEVNPGRVHSSFKLFKMYSPNLEIGPELVKVVLRKLVHGEKADTEYVIDEEGLSNLRVLLKEHVKEINGFETEVEGLLSKLGESGSFDLVEELTNGLLTAEFMARFIKSEDIDNHSYLLMFHKLFSIYPALLSGDDYVKALDIINFKQEKELSGKILDYINESKIDQEAENLRLRVKILECLGIADDNIEVALQKYHQYRTHATYGLHIVSTTMVKVFGYQAIKQDKNIYSTIAATLVPQDTITVKILQTLIITKGYFDKDSALELFNDYINQVSADVSQATRRSAKGLLTEAVCLSSLQNNDRSFAQLVFDKAIDNKIISDEHEIAAVKKVFKAYGDSFIEDDDWSKAKVNMNNYVLNYIKNL